MTGKTPFSIEFFPPQTPAGVDKLRTVRGKLAGTTPDRVAHDIAEALEGRSTVCWSPGILRWLSIPLRIAPDFLARRL